MEHDDREDLPRISVDSIQEWRRIKSNYLSAAIAQLDEQLEASGRIAERETFLAHLTEFVDKTFSLARPNLRVNGRNLEEFEENEEDMDAYDEGLDRMIWSLSDQRLRWNEIVAKKRRTAPLQVEELMHSVLERQRQADAEIQGLLDDLPDDETVAKVQDLDPEVETAFRKAAAAGEELAQSIPVQYERAERVKDVTEEVETRRS